MRAKKFLITALFFIIYSKSFSQILSPEEKKLYELIMEFRKEKGLPNIKLSNSLTFVAQTHVKDLQTNRLFNSTCNMHSWSNNGTWTPCCYTEDSPKASCMWDKPRELTSYKGNGYEISYGIHGASVTAAGALEGWKKSSGHNAVIINQGIWSDSNWNAIGVGISKGYAVVWFGKEYDSN